MTTAAPDLLDLHDRLFGDAAPAAVDLRVRHDGLDHSLSFAQAEAEPVYDVGCLRGLLFGAALYGLAAEGVCDPAAPLSAQLPELGEAADRLSLAGLLSHSSGYFLPPRPARDWADCAAMLAAQGQAFPPGSVVNYNGPEEAMLVEVVRRITGESLYSLVQQRLLAPLAIPLRLGVDYTPLGLTSIALSVEELLRILDRLADDKGPWGPAFFAGLDRDCVHTGRTAHATATRLPVGYSWGFSRFANGLWGQSGSAPDLAIGLRLDPAAPFVAVAAVASSPFRRDRMLEAVCDLFGYPARSGGRRAPLGGIEALDSQALGGRYISSGTQRAEVYVEGDEIRCLFFEGESLRGTVAGLIDEDGVIFGDSRLPTGRLEFFPHPVSAAPVMTFGLSAYVQVDQAA